MTKLCFLLGVCLGYVLMVTAQQPAAVAVCPAATMNELHKCHEELFSEGIKARFALEKEDRECFTAQTCKHFDVEELVERFVEEEKRKEEEKERERHGHSGSGSGSANGNGWHHVELTEAEKQALKEEMNTTIHCFGAIFKKGHEEINKCVENATNGYKLFKGPEHPDYRRAGPREHGRGGRKERGRKHIDEETLKHAIELEEKLLKEIKAAWAKSCNNNTEAEKAVKECLRKNEKTERNQTEQFCQKKHACFEAVTPKCERKQIKETLKKVVEPAARKCVKDEKPDFKQLTAGIPECANVDFAKLAEHHKKHGGPEGKREEERSSGSGSGSAYHKEEHRKEEHEEECEKREPHEEMCKRHKEEHKKEEDKA
jgi:hypothetical protein